MIFSVEPFLAMEVETGVESGTLASSTGVCTASVVALDVVPEHCCGVVSAEVDKIALSMEQSSCWPGSNSQSSRLGQQELLSSRSAEIQSSSNVGSAVSATGAESLERRVPSRGSGGGSRELTPTKESVATTGRGNSKESWTSRRFGNTSKVHGAGVVWMPSPAVGIFGHRRPKSLCTIASNVHGCVACAPALLSR